MQDYNASSIRAHMKEAISLRQREFKSPFPDSLKDKIVKDANGVILWARFAIDHLIDGCDEGLTKEELEERLEDLPQELEELYQRILDKMPPARQSEVALILYLIIGQPPNTRLNELYGAWLFVLRKTDTGFASVILKDVSEFESRLLTISCGLLDISTRVSKDFKYASLIHRTVQSYLDKSNWVQKNLPRAFLSRCPNSPWLRVYAFVLELAALELKISRDQVFELLNRKMGNLTTRARIEAILPSKSWHGWSLILPVAIASFLKLAEVEEKKGCSVFEIIHEAMKTSLISLHLVSEERQNFWSEPPCMPWRTSLSDYKQIRSDRLGLFYGVSHGLVGYVRGCLERDHTLSAQETTILLDLAIFNVDDDPKPRRIEVTRLCFQQYHQTLQSTHLCIIFGSEHTLRALNLQLGPIIQLLQELVQDRPKEPWPWDHHPSCRLRDRHCGPLYHWTQFVADMSFALNPEATFLLFKDLLAFLLGSGEQIDSPCCSDSHVLYAILGPPHWVRSFETPFRLGKFLLAVKAGADTQIAGSSTGVLAHARKLKRSLLFQRVGRCRDRFVKRELKDANAIVKILKDHGKSGGWALFDQYYGEMVEEIAPDTDRSRDEVKQVLAFTHRDHIGSDEMKPV
ncbi:MAG: hypothetical protein Q9160_001448 [Pyrenula sp. 1 TL-2023]